MTKAGQRTVPQIWIGSRHVGALPIWWPWIVPVVGRALANPPANVLLLPQHLCAPVGIYSST